MSRLLAPQRPAATEIITKSAHLRRRPLPRAAITESHDGVIPRPVYDVLRTPGRPLDAHARATMEPRFGYDFSQVRVHTDSAAANSAQQVNAMAYTVGGDMVFSAGSYHPQSRQGQALLAHELTHVVQQRAGQRAHTSNAVPAVMEHEAQRATTTFDGSQQAIGVSAASGPMLARSEQAPALSAESTAVIDVQSTIDAIEGSQQDVADWANDSSLPAKFAAFIPFFLLELLRRTVQLGNALFGVTELQSVADTLSDEGKSGWQKAKAAIWGVILVIMSAMMIEGVAAQIFKWVKGIGSTGVVRWLGARAAQFFAMVFASAQASIPGLRWLWVNARLAMRWFSQTAARIGRTETWQRMVELGMTPVSWKSLGGVADDIMKGVRTRIEQLVATAEVEGAQEAMTATQSVTPEVEAYWQKNMQERAIEFTPDPAFGPELTETTALDGATTPVTTSAPADFVSHVNDPVKLPKTARKPPGFNADTSVGGTAAPGKNLKAGGMPQLELTAYDAARRPPPRYLTDYLQRYGLTFGTEGRAAREAFNEARPGIARALRSLAGEDIHHAIELQVLDYYPGVFSAEELNALSNMRGIPDVPIVAGGPAGSQLHNSMIRKELDQAYAQLDALIEAGGFQPGFPDYNALVREHIEAARRSIDRKWGRYFRWPRPTDAAIVGSGTALVGGALSQDSASPQ